MNEIWRPLVDLEKYYEVSTFGNVRSLDRYVKQKNGRRTFYPAKIKKQHEDKDGYLYTNITGDNIKTKVAVHRLVACTFIPNLKKLPQINHINGDKKDNRVENLEWCTPRENALHAYKTGLASNKGENNANSKLNWEKVNIIREMYATGNFLYKELGEQFGISGEQVSNIVREKSWTREKI